MTLRSDSPPGAGDNGPGSGAAKRPRGHLPGDVRLAFLSAVGILDVWRPGEREPTLRLRDRTVPVSAVCELVVGDRALLPPGIVDDLRRVLMRFDDMEGIGEMRDARPPRTFDEGAKRLAGLIELVKRHDDG